MTPETVRDALRGVIDPELGINVVDLGLVYRVDVEAARVRVVMTMTTPACPLGASLTEQVAAAVRRKVTGVDAVEVELVWDPVWHPSMMSAGAKEQLGWA